MIKVILDTNFLIYCAKNKLDYKEEIGNLLKEGFNLVVPIQVIEELKKVSEKTKIKGVGNIKKRNPLFKRTTGKDKDACKLALQLLDVNNVERVNITGNSVDNAIINLALENSKNIVATLDRVIRKKLQRVILINRFKRLMLTK